MMRILLSAMLSISLLSIYAQPTAVPAPGYQWIKTGASEYTSFLVSTLPNIVSGSTNFGLLDIDPTDCSANCGGNCDGTSKYAASLFGINNTIPVGTNTNCEQRGIKIIQWPNDFIDVLVINGANTGKVQLPTAAKVTMKKSNTLLTPGCGAGSGSSQGKIYGGNGPGNNTKVNIVCNYDISWKSAAFGGIINGGQSWVQNSSFTGPEPGSGLFSNFIDWETTTFGNTITSDVVYDIPVSSISQTGGNFEIVVVSTPSITVTREFGNADAFAETEPGMEGLAEFKVDYDIWEIQQVLPLRLGNFSARLTNSNSVLLNWVNYTEINNDRYIIERSNDGRNWIAAGMVQALINAPRGEGKYSFVDNGITAAQKNIFYRLKLIEKNGGIVYSYQLMIRNGKQTKLSLIAAGASNEYRLITNNNGLHHISIINTSGQLIKRMSVAGGNNSVINLNDLTNGIYAVTLQTGDQKETVRIFINK